MVTRRPWVGLTSAAGTGAAAPIARASRRAGLGTRDLTAGTEALLDGLQARRRARGGAPVPVDRPPEALVERRGGAEPEVGRGAGGVEAAPGLSVRERGVPDQPAAEPGEPRDPFREVLDADLEAGP